MVRSRAHKVASTDILIPDHAVRGSNGASPDEFTAPEIGTALDHHCLRPTRAIPNRE